VKQILLQMNEKWSFIIEDLDDYHLVIKADDEYRVRRELEAEVRVPCPIFNEPGSSVVCSWRRTPTPWRAS
jgi:Transcription factor TFIIH complex subunit Tfb5